MRYFLKATHPNYPDGWIASDGMFIVVTPNASHAEAFPMRNVEQYRQYAMRAWPNSTIIPVECNSRKIIPENMRKLINIA